MERKLGTTQTETIAALVLMFQSLGLGALLGSALQGDVSAILASIENFMQHNHIKGAILQTDDFVGAFHDQYEIVLEHRRAQRAQDDASEAAFVAEAVATSRDEAMDRAGVVASAANDNEDNAASADEGEDSDAAASEGDSIGEFIAELREMRARKRRTLSWGELQFRMYAKPRCNCEGAFGHDSDGEIRHYGLDCGIDSE